MIPFDSFLLDPPMLFASGWLASRITRPLSPARRRTALRALGGGTMAVFWVTSVSLYLNLEWTRWIWEMCRARSGRDWMLNSGVFHFEHAHPSVRTHAVSAGILATYPAWLVLGVRAAGLLGDRAQAERHPGMPDHDREHGHLSGYGLAIDSGPPGAGPPGSGH